MHESHNERGRARDKHPKNTGAKVQCQTFQKEMGSDEEALVSCKQVAQRMHPGLGRTTVKMWFGRLEVKDGAVLASSGLGTYIWREFSTKMPKFQAFRSSKQCSCVPGCPCGCLKEAARAASAKRTLGTWCG